MNPGPATNDQPSGSTELVDAAMVRLAQSGDAQARETLFASAWPVCYRVARRMTGSESDAGDVVQDALVKALLHLENFDHRSSFKTWLLRIVSNCATDHLRRNRRRGLVVLFTSWASTERGPSIEPSAVIDPSKPLLQKDLRQEIDTALASLSDATRQAFVLYAEAEMTYQEVANTLAVPIGTVMSRIHSARKKLQASIQELDNPSPPAARDLSRATKPSKNSQPASSANEMKATRMALGTICGPKVAEYPS